jgi:hypothetical protein
MPTTPRRTAWPWAASLPVAAVFSALLLAPAPVAAQRLVHTPTVDLIGGDTLNVPEPLQTGVAVPLSGGGWLYSGFMERWTWAQFDAAGRPTRIPGRRWTAGGPESSAT